MSETARKLGYDEFKITLDQDHMTGDTIGNPDFNPFTNSGPPGHYLLAPIGIDRFGRVWRHDRDGLTMVADWSHIVDEKE